MKYSQTREEKLQRLLNRKDKQAFSEEASQCVYLHSVNGGCEIGNDVNKSTAERLENLGGEVDIVFKELPKRLQKMDVDFLRKIQLIHDTSSCYNKDGTPWSKKGLLAIHDLATEYSITLKLRESII